MSICNCYGRYSKTDWSKRVQNKSITGTQWQLNSCHCNFQFIKLASLILTKVEVGEKSDIVGSIRTSSNRVKHSPKPTRNSDGWVYESIRIGLPEVMKTNTITLYDTENSYLKCAEKNTKNNSLINHNRVDENGVEENDDSISEHLICCNYCHKKRELGSNFQSLCCSNHSNSSHQCVDEQFIQNTSINKTDPSFYSR